ncbi:MAG: FkbM family methyltransferase [Marinicellaceae bacterium]
MKREPFCFTPLYDDIGMGLTYFGKRILLNTRNIRTYSVISHGKLEPAICFLFEKYIKKDHVVVDIGANVGFLSLLACHLVGPKGHVFSYEPNPDVYALLVDSIDINAFLKRSTTKQLAIYSKSEEVTLTWNSNRDGSGRIVTKTMSGLAEKQAKVKAEPLDKLLKDKKIDFIKIDTEGSEPHVLIGAEKIIQNNPSIKIILEWNPKHIKQREFDINLAKDFIFKYFNSVQLINKINDLKNLNPEDLSQIKHGNLFLSNT